MFKFLFTCWQPALNNLFKLTSPVKQLKKSVGLLNQSEIWWCIYWQRFGRWSVIYDLAWWTRNRIIAVTLLFQITDRFISRKIIRVFFFFCGLLISLLNRYTEYNLQHLIFEFPGKLQWNSNKSSGQSKSGWCIQMWVKRRHHSKILSSEWSGGAWWYPILAFRYT